MAVIVGGILVATIVYDHRLRHGEAREQYRQYRQGVGRAILLGLEVLVAADIIRTVAVDPTFASAGVLAIIVGIRTFLSFSLGGVGGALAVAAAEKLLTSRRAMSQ